jgi:uncharacterized protein YjgD (DUF1641 family)
LARAVCAGLSIAFDALLGVREQKKRCEQLGADMTKVRAAIDEADEPKKVAVNAVLKALRDKETQAKRGKSNVDIAATKETA